MAEGVSLEHHLVHGFGLDAEQARQAARGEPAALHHLARSSGEPPVPDHHDAAPQAGAAHAEEPPAHAVARHHGELPADADAAGSSVPYAAEIDAAAKRYGLDAALLKGLIKQESDFDPNARSPAGAVGLCQLMPGTADALGVDDPLDPAQSIDGGARYLREMLDIFDGDERLGLAAYNAGPGAVRAHGGIPDYPETQEFVRRVLANAEAFRRGDGADVAPTAQAAQADSGSGTPVRRTGVLYLRGDGGDAASDVADPSGSAMVRALKAEAERIDEARVPYRWGGGHAERLAADSPVTPLDCSGAVSRVLGIDPRASGAFATWGEPGPGRRVSIYYNAEHVFMVIDGHFFGTSRSNPGGGPGWISHKLITPEYLARFAVRHPAGM
jgi:hypothetical protein